MSASRAADRIPARNDPAAKKRFLQFLNRSIQTVSANAQWFVLPTGDGVVWNAETRPSPVVLRCGDSGRLHLWSSLQFEYVDHPDRAGERKVRTCHYAHTVSRDDMSTDEVFSWQWHPLETGPTYPHLHVHGTELLGQTLHKLHIPTGRVFLEDVLSFLIEDLRVTPASADWRTVLADNLGRVNTHGTWGTRPIS